MEVCLTRRLYIGASLIEPVEVGDVGRDAVFMCPMTGYTVSHLGWWKSWDGFASIPHHLSSSSFERKPPSLSLFCHCGD
jgi:hypothetical protein